MENTIQELFSWTLSALYIYMIVAIIIAILLDNRDPAKSLAWITILVLLPVVGIILYLFFGHDFRKQKIITKLEAIKNNKRDLLF